MINYSHFLFGLLFILTRRKSALPPDFLIIRVVGKIARGGIFAPQSLNGVFEFLKFEVVDIVAVDRIEQNGQSAFVAVRR